MNKFIISESEKERILNMHKSSSSRHYLREATMAPEPVINGGRLYKLWFLKDGDYIISDADQTAIKNWLRPLIYKSLPTIKKFYKDPNYPLPKFITIGAGTTSTGSYEVNAEIGQKRINSVIKIVKDLLGEKDFDTMNAEMKQRLLTTNSDYTYNPTNLDANFSDRNRAESKDKERFVYVIVMELTTKGLSPDQITDVEHGLEDAIDANGNPLFSNFDPDETEIKKQICKLKTYSDITALNKRVGNLQKWINDSITDDVFWDDSKERNQIMGCLNTAAENSDKGKIAKIIDDKIVIILQ
jgi:hypothetical protein